MYCTRVESSTPEKLCTIFFLDYPLRLRLRSWPPLPPNCAFGIDSTRARGMTTQRTHAPKDEFSPVFLVRHLLTHRPFYVCLCAASLACVRAVAAQSRRREGNRGRGLPGSYHEANLRAFQLRDHTGEECERVSLCRGSRVGVVCMVFVFVFYRTLEGKEPSKLTFRF